MASIMSAELADQPPSHPGHTGGRHRWIVAAIGASGSGHPGGGGPAVEGNALRFLAVWLGLTAEVNPPLHLQRRPSSAPTSSIWFL
jgi:hypothetical protein